MCLLFLVALGCMVVPANADPIVPLAIVNGDTISSADMDRLFMTMHRQLSDDDKDSFDYEKLVQKLINDRLILQEALAIGMDQEEEFHEQLSKLRRDRARRLFVKETFDPNIEITEEDIRARFESFYFKIQYRTLAVASEAEAERLAAEIRGGASMDSLAREGSLDSRKYQGGLHTLKYWRDVPIVLRLAAQHLEVGELSAPFAFRDAFMVLRVEQRDEADLAELDQMRNEITTILTNTARDAAWSAFLDSLAGDYPQSTDSSLLRDIMADSAVLFHGEFLKGSERPVITVAPGEIITDNELRRNISHTAMNAGDQVFDTIMYRALTGRTQEARLQAASTAGGFLAHPSVVDYLARLQDSILIENYLGENVVNRIKFNREEFREYYDEHLDDFREPDEVRLKALQLDSQAKADEAAAQLADGADFDYVATRLGRDGGVDHDENQWFNLETFPAEVAADLERLQIGQSAKPFQLSDGWVIFQLKAQRPGDVKTMTEVDGQIREVMFQRKFQELLDELLTSLKSASEIEIKEDAINEYLGADR